MSSLGRSKTVRGAYPVYDQKGVKASPNAKVVPSKTAPPKTAQAKGTLPTSNTKTSYKVRSEDQESNGVNVPGIATKHRDDVYTNNDDPPEETGIDDFAKSKVKNVAIDEEEDEDEERYFTDLHRKICRYCDLHGEVGHELPTWIDKAGRRDPRIRESLGKVIEGGGTLLHALVKVPPLSLAAIKTRFDQRYEAIRYILENYPELYSVRDHIDNRTVLDEAIMRFHLPKLKGLNPFVNYFVQQLPVETARQMDRDPEDEEMHMGNSLKSPIIQLISMICGPDVQGPGSLGGLLPHLSGDVLRKMDTNKNTVLHLAVRYKFACDEAEESQEILKNQIQTLIETHPELIGVLNNNNESPYLYRVNTTQAYFTQNGGDLPLKDVLTDYLKDLCMHQPIEEAITLLYGPRSGQEHQISLNLFELSRKSRAKDHNTLTKAKLMRFLDRFHFESILQFVLIPRLQLAPEAKNPDATPGRPLKASRRNSSLNDGIGRDECNEILGYLRGKGVRKIIELVVDDDQDPPHTDTIIQSLNTFDIEIFDWKKIDLCSDTIFKAAPYAHKICLYSSGNNAVLRSWSAADGLARFTKLREVEIEVRQRIESTAATKTMIGQFRERMAENCPQVTPDQLSIRQRKNTEPTVAATSGGLGAGNAPEFVSVSINTWMSTMQNFANFIRNIPDSDLSTYRHIKVAVIDDGIDAVFNEEQFASTLKGGESFCTGPKRPPYFFSSTGHGTLMADLVQRVCPKVHLYVARLDELEGEGNRQPTPESAAKAIQWAIQQEVDIISMSWTITSKYEHIIRPAIQEADRKNILMFGAASDQGYNAASKVYPAEYPEVFCIGAAKATGRADAAAELQAKFVFPGGERSEMRITRPNDNALDHAWGSSFATALASGLAALLLDCAELVGLGKHREAIKKRDNLDRIFTDMIREKGSKYIPVTQYFTPELAALAWDTEGKTKFKKAIKNILRPVLDQ